MRARRVEQNRPTTGRMPTPMESETFDHVIVGGGLVGLATALAHSRAMPDDRILLIEKERAVACHQSGRNSGVLHAGVYYAVGSAKARLCRAGRAAMLDFCRERAIPHRLCGKVIVATTDREVARLAALEDRARGNGVAVERIDAARLAEIEPEVRGLAALHVRESGVVDFRAVAREIARELESRGVAIWLGEPFVGSREDSNRLRVFTETRTALTRRIVTCAGLHADRVARAALARSEVSIVPFRGEYARLRPERARLVRSLVYPVPDPKLPFLGVHFTRDVAGNVECGPNAVLAFAREGYEPGSFDPRDAWDTLAAPGFLRFAAGHARYALAEFTRSLDPARFAAEARRLVPALADDDLEPAPSGIRAQAIDRSGSLVDDFAIVTSKFGVHVLNAPSPAATASFAIAEVVVRRAVEARDG